MMGRKTIELRAIWNLSDGTEGVQTGIYVFNTTTLQECIDLMKGYADRGEKVPDRIEFSTNEEDD